MTTTPRPPLDARAHAGDGDSAAREAGAVIDVPALIAAISRSSLTPTERQLFDALVREKARAAAQRAQVEALRGAIGALLDDYQLEDYVELIRDEVKGDPAHNGLSTTHPRVRRFREICRVLRAAADGQEPPA